VNAVADIAISTSLNEGMPISLIESQLAGLPVVAMDVGAISEVVIDRRTGFVCGDLQSQFIPSLRTLVLDSALREWMSKNAADHALEKFSIPLLISNHLKLFERLTLE
jgi:glycosyltransferase involved in cell wall biosynthesis